MSTAAGAETAGACAPGTFAPLAASASAAVDSSPDENHGTLGWTVVPAPAKPGATFTAMVGARSAPVAAAPMTDGRLLLPVAAPSESVRPTAAAPAAARTSSA